MLKWYPSYIFVIRKLNTMPNWCSNLITITGDKKKISIIKHALESIKKHPEGEKEPYVFETLVGREPHLTGGQYTNEWYNSNVGYWGTKWDVSYDSCGPEYGDEEIKLCPDTAWSPPIEFCNQLVKMYGVKVYIFYSEPGIGFSGQTDIYLDEDGILHTDDEEYGYLEGLYILDKDQFWGEVEYYIDSYGENDEDSVEKYVEETFPFITEEDKKDIINQINEHHNE